MKCTINDVNLSFDTKGRLRKTILRVSGHDAHKAYVLAAFLYDAGFNQFLLNSIKPEDVIKGETISFDNITPEDCLKINQNKLASLFREYYVNHYLSVHNSTTNKGFGGLNGFTSASAKNVAKSHHASLIIDEYQKELNKNPKDRRKNIEIIKDVNARIEKTFNKRAEDFASYVIEHSEYSLEAKAYAKKCVNVFTQINELNKKLDKYSESIDYEVSLGKTFAEEIKKLKAQKITKETKKHIIELTKSYKEVIAKVESIQKERDKVLEEGSELNVEKRLLLQNLINQFADTTDSKHGIRLRNYANLFAQSLYNSNEWYFQVFNTKQMTSINNSFNNIDDIESYIEEENDNSENNFSKYNGESIDETTKSWEDSLYKNFTQAVDGKLKVILSTLPKLEEKFNPTDEVQAIDTNNELGVQTYMDYQFVSVQIFTFGDFSSVESLIRSLDEKSKQIKSLYGIGKLVQMMKSRRSFANYVYSNFSKPIAKKTILTIHDIMAENGIEFSYSNENSFPLANLVFRMSNKLRATYNSTYNIEDIDALNKLEKDYSKTKNKKEFCKNLFEVVNKYFPNFDKTIFNNYFDNLDDKQFDNSANTLIRSFKTIITGIGKLKTAINKKEVALRKQNEYAWKAYRLKQEIWKNTLIADRKEENRPILPTNKYLDYNDIDLTPTIYSAILTFANEIVGYTESVVNLNSTNAEGSSASNVVKNCYITRFFDQILAETEEDSQAGLKALGTYLLQTKLDGRDNQYKHNPIFFGLRDENGVLIKDKSGYPIYPGMFTITDNGFEINPNAKELLRYNLFDGTQNTQEGNGNTYSKLSKLDFFLTQLYAFNKSTEEYTKIGRTTAVDGKETANYAMRIGADAPKIYFIRGPKFSKNECKYAIYNHVMNELTMFVNGISELFQQEENAVQDGEVKPFFRTRKDITPLIGRAFYDERVASEIKYNGSDDFTKAIVKDGKLVGNLFKFVRLFNLEGYNAGEQIEQLLSLYGGVDEKKLFTELEDGGLMINQNDTIFHDGDKFVLNLSDEQKVGLKKIVSKWVDAFLAESKQDIAPLLESLNLYNVKYDIDSIDNFLLNYVNMNMCYDDFFEGDFKFYNNARDFLKRTKETQAGGDGYVGAPITDFLDTSTIKDLSWNNNKDVIKIESDKQFDENNNPVLEDVIINGQKLIARTGFRGVTIYNTIKASDYADQLQKELEDNFIKQGIPQEKAHKMSINIAKGYGQSASETIKGQLTKINDAQSYITLEEFIRRRYADGTIDEYKDLIKVLTDDTPIEEIDFDKINSRIQVQKNFYYDKVFDKDTGMFYPRQIKNAEFVLIPKLLPKDSQLRKIYDWMQKNDIGQLNTAETSKAAKKDIFTIWDPKTEQFDENFEEKFDEHYVENYDYRYLYEQQEVPQHMIDETNKAGLQITKKIIDNVISEIDENNPERKIVQTWADEYQEAFTENIEESFYLFLDNMGWAYDANNGKIINAEYETTDENGDPLSDEVIESNKSTLNFDNFYTRAREEAARVGMDNNFMEYLIPDEFGNPKMPNFMNSVSSKLQSIAQAIFNRRITRQTLPGWHAAQITGVGYSKHLEFDVKTGTMEVYLPRWSNLIPKGKTPEEDAEILRQIQEEGLDIHLGYRIPTEGKQSIAILKVVGFTNECLGSTIVVPNEWVTQTGADFDVDSIYGINYEIYATKDENGKTIVKKVPCTEEEFDEQRGYIIYVNTKLNAKVTKDKYGNEIKNKVKELRDSLNVQIKQERESENTKLSEKFNELDNSRNELYNRLPKSAKWTIIDLNKTAKKEKRKRKDVKNEVTDLIDLYSRINSDLLELIENKKIEGENKELILEYIDYQNGIINVINAQQGLPVFNKEQYFSKKAELIDSIIQQAKIDYFNKVESAAKDAGLMDYNTWKQQPFIKKLDRRGRNNYIIDRMINIMKHESSREEQYGRSHFENILNGENGANDIIDKISNKSKKAFSPYNPISQLNYFDDSLGGAKLKALSVMWDTFLSKNNRIRTSLSNNEAIDAIIELTPGVIKDSQVEYDIDEIRQSYDEDVYDYVEPKVKPIRTPKTVGYLNMDMSYYNNKRPTVTAYTTFDAILNKERTATTRYNNLDYIKTFKVGDIIEIRNKDNRVCYVRITKCGFLDKNTSAEEWSQKEGWSVNYFNKKVQPIVGKGMAYQLEYELVDLTQLSDEECISTAKLNKNTSIKHNEIYGVGDKIKDYVLYTGTQYDGSFTKGGDSIFHDVATEYGLKTVGYSQRDMYDLDKEKLEKIEKEYANETEWLGRTFIPTKGKGGMLMRRDYLQAESADAIFAVAEILQPGDKNSKGFINTSKGPSVDGGTAYAVQFAIKMGKPIHVYRPSLRQWFTYDYNTKTYIPESTPALTPKFAGIGSRLVAENEDVKNAVRHLFETTKVGTGTLKNSITENEGIKSLEAQQNEKEIVEETKEENSKSKKVLFKARRLGYSNNNRNIVGNYVTNYSSQTTAHHLDAVKEGSVPNVNEYTFNVYKLLSSVGLDYEFVIGFMRQPIITKLVKTNNQINSIFFSVDENPITSLLIDIVKNSTAFKGDNLHQAIDYLKLDIDFADKFNQLFNVNIMQLTVDEILNLKVPLDKARLFSRIERDANNKSNNWDKAFDFAMLLNFKQYAKIGDTINKIIRSTNADKYGSKPEISENRKTIEEIEELRGDTTLSRDGFSFINLIFPKDIYKKELNINVSNYKSIAAVYKYATVLSQQVNTKLFVTENEEFNIAEKEIEKLFGKRFNKNESKELRRYAIMTLYNQIEKLLTPLTLDKKGNIKIDTSAIEKTESEQNIAESYWDAERSRICGYGITTDGNFKIENVNKPTKQEIEQFKKLTPVQKVIFMQKNFPDEQGIFNCLNVTLLNPYDIKSKGVSRQYMSYNDQVYNIDDLVYLFSKAFTNHNPLIKLTAVDCIKYAFIAEGFNYKTGYITKLIPNDALYNGENEGGMDIISGQTLENNMKLAIHTLPETMITEEFKDNFVRSHRQFIKTIRMPKLPQKEIKNGESVYKFKNASVQFISNMRQDGLVYIDATDTNNLSSLINKLKINNKDYIKVCYPINDEKTNTTVYKVERTNPIYIDGTLVGYNDYFLIPLNLLDSSETYDYSYNANNNKWNSIEYYYDVIDNISKIANKYRTDNTERKTKDIFNKSAKYKNKLEPVGSYTQNSVDLNLDSYGLMKLAEESDENTKRIVSRLVNGIKNHFANLEPGEITPYAQLHLNPLIAKLIPANSMVEQIIELPNGSEIEVQIGHLKMNEKNTQILKNRLAGKIKVEEYGEVIKDLRNSNTLPEKAQIYRVIPVKKDKKVVESNILNASTGLITGASTANPLTRKRRDNIDIVSKQMMSEIKYDARKNKHNIAEQFVREMEYLHVNRNMSTSLESNRKNIYRSAAKYYTSAANEIINKVNKFKIVDDLGNEQEFSIDDPALYEALAENDQYFGEIAQLILDGITFGNRIAEIFKLDITAEDIETKESIEKIINAINAVKQNKKLKDAMNNLINIYFKKYSTNPDIMRDIISLRETYGDLDVLDAWIADPTDIDNNEVQVILKKVYGMFAKAEMFDVERNMKEYKDEIERIKAMSGSLDINKVINFDNMSIRQDFTEDFLVQKEAVKDRLTEARKHKDENLEAYKQYILAKYERDKFMYENTEQSIIEDYYAQDLKLRADVIRNADDSYFKYMQITEEIRNLNESNLTEEEKNEKRKLLFTKINELRSEVDIITGTPKSMREIAKAKALNEYIEAKSKLQEKYFESQEYEGFQETYKRYKAYIDKYNSEFFYKSLSEKLEDSKYKEAYDWIRTNGKLKFAENERKKLQNAFKILNGGKTSINKTILNSLKKLPGVVDENGNINPLNLTEAQIEYIKDQEESDLAKVFEDGLGEDILIKDVPNDIALIKTPNDKEGIAIFKLNSYDATKLARKRELIGEINEILKKVVDKDTGRLNMQLLFNDAVVNDEERIKLSNLYNELGKLNKKRFKKRKNKVFEDEIDDEAFLRAFSFYKTKLKGTKYESQFLNIFTIIDETGRLVANPLIYGYMVPNDEYIDYEKTEALDYIRDNVDFVTTEYYEQAKQQAISQGQEAFDKWFKLNHVYNPYTHRYEPLKIWTTIDAKPGSELAASITYFPSFQNRERFVKPEFINNKANRAKLGIGGNGYQEFGNNYKTTHKTHDGKIVNNRFNSNLNLNDKERALRNHLTNTLNKYATTYQGKRFVGQGYLPRERQNEITGKYIAGQLGALLGMSWHSGADSDNFHDTVDYSHDREATFDMLTLIKGKGTKKYESAPERGDMSIEEYEKKLEEVREKNKQIKKENEEIDKKLVNRDWETVMEHFVHNATIFNSRQAAKPYLYLLLEDLANNNAYMIKGIWNRRVIKNKETSTDDDVQYKTIKQERTYEIIHNLARRLLFDQYHENHPFRPVMNFLQNLTSAKYMVFNVYGGVANVLTGKVNIAREAYAKEYFGFKEYREAELRYLQSIPSMTAYAYSEKAHNITDALIKKFHVVDYDQMLQFGEGSKGLDETLRRIRNGTYAFQSCGEHYMQNTVLLAMLNTNKLYIDRNGVQRIGSLHDFTWDVEQQALEQVLSEYPDLLINYENYLDNIKYDVEEKLKIDSGRLDFNRKYLNSLKNYEDSEVSGKYKEINQKYNETRKKLLEERKKEFIENKNTVESLFEFKDGKAVLKQEAINNFNAKGKNKIGDLHTLIAEFREKVISVNKKIHGVYDKNGAAQIEKKWFGSVLMQYHKHLWTNIMKRWRRKGYFSEFRGTKEYGSYQSVIDFLGTEFIDMKSNIKKRTENGENIMLASIQVAMQGALNTIMSIQSNYTNLPTWQKANIRRNIAEIAGILVACAVVLALYGANDDDEIKDDVFKSSLLYIADRLYSETSMYTPVGLVTESKTLYSSPIASANGPSDLLKMVTLIPQALFDPDYNPNYQTGQYAGRNKFEVLFRRNIPGVRPYDRIQFITKNNKYYKIGNSHVGINLAKTFGESIND